MSANFEPNYKFSSKIYNNLIHIDSMIEQINEFSLSSTFLSSLQESSKIYKTHFSTKIDGNALTMEQVEAIIRHGKHFPEQGNDEKEVLGYYAALERVDLWVESNVKLSENLVQILHSLTMSNGKAEVEPKAYRTQKNVVRDIKGSALQNLPEAKELPDLMKGLVFWINAATDVPSPVVAGIAQFQFAAIHPYGDGNGRASRLLSTFILQRGGYDLKGLCSLEKYFSRDMGSYYEAVRLGHYCSQSPTEKGYDLTSWLEYFTDGLVYSCEEAIRQIQAAVAQESATQQIINVNSIDPARKKVLDLFQDSDTVTASQIDELFGFEARTRSQMCNQWTEAGFLEVVEQSSKEQVYRLTQEYEMLLRRSRS